MYRTNKNICKLYPINAYTNQLWLKGLKNVDRYISNKLRSQRRLKLHFFNGTIVLNLRQGSINLMHKFTSMCCIQLSMSISIKLRKRAKRMFEFHINLRLKTKHNVPPSAVVL